MPSMQFHPQAVFHEQAERVLSEEVPLLQLLLPWADIQHIGSTAIPGTITKGDMDLVVRVPKEKFAKSRDRLNSIYDIHQPENWSSTFVSFKDDRKALPLGIQLTILHGEDDVFIRFRDQLRTDPQLLAEYNALKENCQNQSAEFYLEKKGAFFESWMKR
jgi:GrpB-like predicted nucleotidyltransferase (UPF0157 family)